MTRGRTSPALGAAAVAAGLLPLVALALLPLIAPSPEPPREPPPESPVETVLFDLPPAGGTAVRALAGGETHRYRFVAEPGTYVEIAVEQRGVDLAVTLLDAAGQTLRQTDTPINDRGSERLLALLDNGGEHTVEVQPFAADADGRYALTVRALRAATPGDRERGAAAAAFADAERAWWSGDAAAAERYRRALALQHAAGDRFGEAESHDRLGRLARGAGERRLAIEHHAAAADLYAAAGDGQREAIARTHRASALLELGDPDAAEADYRRALPLARAAGDLTAAARIHHGLAAVHRTRGDPAAALAAFEQALDAALDPAARAGALYDSGRLLLALGDHAGARRRFDQAAELFARLGDDRGHARTLQEAAWVELWLGDPEAAAAVLERSLALHRQHGNRQAEAEALVDLAVVARTRGEPAAARDHYRRAGELFAELELPAGEMLAERGLAVSLLALGDLDAALAHAERAVDLGRRLADPDDQAAAFADLALVEGAAAHAAGAGAAGDAHLARALAAAERSVTLTEELRRLTPGLAAGATGDDTAADLRATFLAGVRERYERWIDLEMAAHRRHPEAGHAARAFEIGERARARSLLDLLGGDDGGAVDDGEAVRRRLLDDGTVVLAYSLGGERSWLWRLDHRGLAAWELPPRLEVHAVARRAVELLRRSHRRETRTALTAALCDAARVLLAPAAADGGLGDARLAVVGEGILHFLPFAALPDPAAGDCTVAPPLVARHELVALPSLATLDLLRRRHAGRAPAPGALAAIGDPVFGADDPRLAGLAVEPAADGTPPDDDLPRLPASRIEAAAAVARAPGETLLATGFDASEDLFTSGRLARYRVVHLATHARVDGDRPRASGIALSRFDAGGRRRDGLLDAAEIHRLDLPAELVVLAGCRTALGRRVSGEGLVGFSRGFFDAGAPRLLVSLWSVDDRATAELMGRFYEHLFADHLPPAAALAAAQRALAADPRWRAPYHWAGFQLVGEWRGWEESGGGS